MRSATKSQAVHIWKSPPLQKNRKDGPPRFILSCAPAQRVGHPPPKEAVIPRHHEFVVPRSSCSPAVESAISGEVKGWDGETIFKLDNGQIWQQSEYDYTYFYEYHPDVTIYETTGGCRMKVEDESDTVLVKRIK